MTNNFNEPDFGSLRRVLIGFMALVVLIPSLTAQTESTQATTEVVEPTIDLPLVEPSAVPRSATFWLYSTYGMYGQNWFGPPLPSNPWGTNVDVFSWTNDYGAQFVIDDSAIATLRAQSLTNAELRGSPLLLSSSEETLESEGGGAYGPMDALSFPSNSLYLDITDTSAISNGWIGVTLYGTVGGAGYDLLFKNDLADTNWLIDQTLTGTTNQDWTFTWVSMVDRTNLFLWAYSWVDTDGHGLPDWWQLQYFGHLGVDPYSDPDGDGFTNIEEYRNRTSPRIFNTPSAPRDLKVTLDQSTWTATITWASDRAPITGYTIVREDAYLFYNGYYEDIGATNTSFNLGVTNKFVDTHYLPYTNVLLLPNVLAYPGSYAIQAHYPQGDSAWASYLWPWAEAPLGFTAAGPSNTTVLGVKNIPAGASYIRVFKYDLDYSKPYTNWEYLATNVDIPVNSFSNIFYTLPAYMTVTGPDWSDYIIQAFWPDGSRGLAGRAGYPFEDFHDARSQLTQNLAFVLRGADPSGPLFLSLNTAPIDYPLGYTFAGYDSFGLTGSSESVGGNWRLSFPFSDNYLYRNCVWSTNDYGSDGSLNTGFHTDFALSDPLKYVMPTNLSLLLPLLSASQTTWICPRSDPAELGIQTLSTTFSLPNGIQNWFGLPLVNVLVGHNGPSGAYFLQLNAGATVPKTNGTYYFYPNFAQPQLSISGYYFERYDWNFNLYGGPIPSGGFSPTNTQRLLTGEVGGSYTFIGYAKQTVLNGYTNVPAYLGQYFESACKANTTNETGILSPYGDFLPTESGAITLVTMPDLNSGQRGTNIFQVISLSTDANNDGTIDTTFASSDFTTQAKPFRFWVNDNEDSGDVNGDGIPGKPLSVADGTRKEGFMYGTGETLYTVQGIRDLIDYFPVYLNISNLVAALPPSASVKYKLKQDDGDALRFVTTSLTPGNFKGYLTNTNTARSLEYTQATTITYSGVELGSNFVNSIATGGKGIILVEGAKPTSSPLVLEVWQGTALVAKASLYLNISGVEDMFRHKNLMLFQNSTNACGPADRLTSASVPNEPPTNDKNFVFLHGYNVDPDHARGTFADVFKRLYWSGSHAKFYGVTYRGNESQIAGKVTTSLQTNIVNAFLTAPRLADFLATLTNETVVAAHSLGNVVVLSALSDWNANVQKYFMIDAALAIEAIDGAAAMNTNMIHPDWNNYTNRLWASKWSTLFPTNDYRSTLTWSNRLANLPITNIYNFYSSGEEVLREYAGQPPDILSAVFTQVIWDGLFGADPVGTYTWVWQEKLKGRCDGDVILGSSHGGWKFNTAYDSNYFGGVVVHMPSTNAALLSNSQLQTNAFFGATSPAFGYADTNLFGSSGSTYAQATRNRILADSIPALTLPVGANPVPVLQVISHNFNMETTFKNGWPSSRASDQGRWHHSDFREVAYTFTYKLFDEIVNDANLK